MGAHNGVLRWVQSKLRKVAAQKASLAGNVSTKEGGLVLGTGRQGDVGPVHKDSHSSSSVKRAGAGVRGGGCPDKGTGDGRLVIRKYSRENSGSSFLITREGRGKRRERKPEGTRQCWSGSGSVGANSRVPSTADAETAVNVCNVHTRVHTTSVQTYFLAGSTERA